MARLTYVLSQSNTWHWCRNCPSYPMKKNIKKTRATRPDWDLCDKCKGMERNSNCRG